MKQAEASSGQARIYDQGYKPFRGTLASVNTRFLAITRNEFHQVWKNKWFRRLIWTSFMAVIVATLFTLAQQKLSIFGQQLEGPTGLSQICIICKFWDFELFITMIVVYIAGRNAIGEDLRTGALTVFFSRPISFTQYLLGKWLAISLAIAMVTLMPGVVLILINLLIGSMSFVETMQTILAMMLLSAITFACFGWVMIAISCIVGRGRAAGIVWVLVYLFTSGIGESIAEATGREYFRAIGLSSASSKTAEVLFGNNVLDGLALANIGGLLLWAVFGFLVVLFRLRRWMGK